MILGFLVSFCVGLALLWMGLLLWKKQRLSLLHEYHYQNVRPEDIPAYTRRMGQALALMGLGLAVTAVLVFLTALPLGWLPAALCCGAGIVLLYRAQKKYNGSLFS
ncbi:MAG: hypothetical protein ACSW8F_02565 [bacterium]